MYKTVHLHDYHKRVAKVETWEYVYKADETNGTKISTVHKLWYTPSTFSLHVQPESHNFHRPPNRPRVGMNHEQGYVVCDVMTG